MSEHDQSLAEAIATAARNAFSEWREAHQGERVFAFALTTIDDALYVSASVNTDQSHKRTLEKSRILPDTRDALYYKWGPWDWEFEFIAPSHFKGVDGRIKAMYEKMHGTQFAEFRERVLESIIEALILLRSGNAIQETSEVSEVVFFATIYDSSDAENLQLRSAEAANPAGSIAEFLSSFRE